MIDETLRVLLSGDPFEPISIQTTEREKIVIRRRDLARVHKETLEVRDGAKTHSIPLSNIVCIGLERTK